MKKLVFIAASALLLTGCAANQSSTAEKSDKARTSQRSAAKVKHESKKQPVKTQSETVYYHQLTQADRNNVTFAFQAIQDATKAAPGQAANAPSPFSVDMQVTNNSDKTIKLDESKIVWLMPNIDPVSADQSQVLTIEPQQTANVAEIFSNFNGQSFVDAGAFCYMNSDYKLAYSYLAHNEGGVTSKNLTDPKLIAMNDPASRDNTASEADDDTEPANSQDYTSQQLALLALIYGQADPDEVDVTEQLNNYDGCMMYYSDDTATTGHVSVGTPISYEQYSVSGDTLMIMHPAGQGSDAWSGNLNLNDALDEVFVQNADQAEALLDQMQQE